MNDLAHLHHIASEVPQQPWSVYERPSLLGVTSPRGRVVHQPMPNGEKPGMRAAVEYIAAFDPPTVLALIEELQSLRSVTP